MRVFIPFLARKMVRHRDWLPRASKLRHVAHLTECKMLWLAHIPHNTLVKRVNKVNRTFVTVHKHIQITIFLIFILIHPILALGILYNILHHLFNDVYDL